MKAYTCPPSLLHFILHLASFLLAAGLCLFISHLPGQCATRQTLDSKQDIDREDAPATAIDEPNSTSDIEPDVPGTVVNDLADDAPLDIPEVRNDFENKPEQMALASNSLSLAQLAEKAFKAHLAKIWRNVPAKSAKYFDTYDDWHGQPYSATSSYLHQYKKCVLESPKQVVLKPRVHAKPLLDLTAVESKIVAPGNEFAPKIRCNKPSEKPAVIMEIQPWPEVEPKKPQLQHLPSALDAASSLPSSKLQEVVSVEGAPSKYESEPAQSSDVAGAPSPSSLGVQDDSQAPVKVDVEEPPMLPDWKLAKRTDPDLIFRPFKVKSKQPLALRRMEHVGVGSFGPCPKPLVSSQVFKHSLLSHVTNAYPDAGPELPHFTSEPSGAAPEAEADVASPPPSADDSADDSADTESDAEPSSLEENDTAEHTDNANETADAVSPSVIQSGLPPTEPYTSPKVVEILMRYSMTEEAPRSEPTVVTPSSGIPSTGSHVGANVVEILTADSTMEEAPASKSISVPPQDGPAVSEVLMPGAAYPEEVETQQFVMEEDSSPEADPMDTETDPGPTAVTIPSSANLAKILAQLSTSRFVEPPDAPEMTEDNGAVPAPVTIPSEVNLAQILAELPTSKDVELPNAPQEMPEDRASPVPVSLPYIDAGLAAILVNHAASQAPPPPPQASSSTAYSSSAPAYDPVQELISSFIKPGASTAGAPPATSVPAPSPLPPCSQCGGRLMSGSAMHDSAVDLVAMLCYRCAPAAKRAARAQARGSNAPPPSAAPAPEPSEFLPNGKKKLNATSQKTRRR